MTWKRRLNAALAQWTGYELTRVRPAQLPLQPTPAPIIQPAPKPAPKPVTPPPPSDPAPRPASGAAPVKFPADFDDEAEAVITAVKPWTMTSPEKLYALILATRYVSHYRIPGDVVECGVWRGGSMQAAARTLLAVGDVQRGLYLFDTFEGMPPPYRRPLGLLWESQGSEPLRLTNVRLCDDVASGRLVCKRDVVLPISQSSQSP